MYSRCAPPTELHKNLCGETCYPKALRAFADDNHKGVLEDRKDLWDGVCGEKSPNETERISGTSLHCVPPERLLIGPLTSRSRFPSLFKTEDKAPLTHKHGKPQNRVAPQNSLLVPHGWWLAEGAFHKTLEQTGPCVWSPITEHCAWMTHAPAPPAMAVHEQGSGGGV